MATNDKPTDHARGNFLVNERLHASIAELGKKGSDAKLLKCRMHARLSMSRLDQKKYEKKIINTKMQKRISREKLLQPDHQSARRCRCRVCSHSKCLQGSSLFVCPSCQIEKRGRLSRGGVADIVVSEGESVCG